MTNNTDETAELIKKLFPCLDNKGLFELYLDAVSVKKYARKQGQNPNEEVLFFLGLLTDKKIDEAKSLLGKSKF